MTTFLQITDPTEGRSMEEAELLIMDAMGDHRGHFCLRSAGPPMDWDVRLPTDLTRKQTNHVKRRLEGKGFKVNKETDAPRLQTEK